MKQLVLTIVISTVFFSTIKAQGSYEYKNKGYFNLSEISYHKVTRLEEDYLENGIDNLIVKYTSNNIHGVGVQSINGWFLGPFISVGLGLAYDYYNEQKLSVFPIFFDLRIYFSNSQNSFFIYGDIGSVLGSTPTYYIRSAVFATGIGYKFSIRNINGFTMSIGFDGKSFAKSDYPAPNPVHAFVVNSTVVKIGYLF